MLFILAFTAIFHQPFTCNCEWISVTDPSLFRKVEFGAVGTYGDSIYLMGDKDLRQSLQEYQISSNSFVDLGTSALPQNSFQWGQFYNQFQNNLYICDGINVQIYNLASTNFPNDASLITTTSITTEAGFCLAASQDFVFIQGGWSVGDVLNILSLSDSTWSLGPSTTYANLDHNCVVVSDYLYIIGGLKVNIERISIIDIQNQQWTAFGSLTESVALSGITVVDDIIWVIGGRTTIPVAWTYVDKVWNIDTTDGSITLLADRLPYGIAHFGAAVAVNNVVYVFDGSGDGNNLEHQLHWMYYDLDATPTTTTEEPTYLPTDLPTNLPTAQPTKIPTITPTLNPTKAPTMMTTKSPTSAPTKGPAAVLVVVPTTKTTTVSETPTAARDAPVEEHETTQENENYEAVGANDVEADPFVKYVAVMTSSVIVIICVVGCVCVLKTIKMKQEAIMSNLATGAIDTSAVIASVPYNTQEPGAHTGALDLSVHANVNAGEGTDATQSPDNMYMNEIQQEYEDDSKEVTRKATIVQGVNPYVNTSQHPVGEENKSESSNDSMYDNDESECEIKGDTKGGTAGAGQD